MTASEVAGGSRQGGSSRERRVGAGRGAHHAAARRPYTPLGFARNLLEMIDAFEPARRCWEWGSPKGN